MKPESNMQSRQSGWVPPHPPPMDVPLNNLPMSLQKRVMENRQSLQSILREGQAGKAQLCSASCICAHTHPVAFLRRLIPPGEASLQQIPR